ncbi:MAG: carbohydrate ABC transporter permease [bacterium]|nr:carbohydrate ABC transporter permease [Candidatus Sumerlaeota bacterium]
MVFGLIKRAARHIPAVAGHAVLIAGGATMALPFLWMLSTALQSRAQLYSIPPRWLPSPPQWANFTEVWFGINFFRYFLNSCFISAVVTTLSVILCAMAGFAFAKYTFPGKRPLFLYFICTLMVPYQVTLIPLFLVFRGMNLLDTYTALILPGLTSAFGIFMMRQFITDIPEDLLDSARIDGSGEAGLFTRVILPNIKPAASALAIFIFIGIWNDFMWPLIAINRDELKPIQAGLASFVQQHAASWHLVMAGATCALAPVIAVFLIFQRQFVSGIAFTGIKE